VNKILSTLVKKFGKYHLRKGVEYAFRCPKCEDARYRMDVNLKIMAYNCFHCGESGSVYTLLKEMNDFLYRQAVDAQEKSICKMFNYSFSDPKECKMPKGFKKFQKNMGITVSMEMQDFFVNRKLDWMKLGDQWGYCEDNWRMRNRLIIPIIEDRKTVCWIARSVDGRKPKELSPEASEANKSHYFYGLDLISQGDEVVLVEGIFDCERAIQYEYKSVSSLGCHLSEVQVGKLLAKKPSKIYIMFDGDDAGRKGTTEAYRLLAQRGGNPHCIYLPSGMDPDELTKEEFEELIK
jgi:DNA primase